MKNSRIGTTKTSAIIQLNKEAVCAGGNLSPAYSRANPNKTVTGRAGETSLDTGLIRHTHLNQAFFYAMVPLQRPRYRNRPQRIPHISFELFPLRSAYPDPKCPFLLRQRPGSFGVFVGTGECRCEWQGAGGAGTNGAICIQLSLSLSLTGSPQPRAACRSIPHMHYGRNATVRKSGEAARRSKAICATDIVKAAFHAVARATERSYALHHFHFT